MRCAFLQVGFLAGTALAQDPQLAALHATLSDLHSHAGTVPDDYPGANPELTVAKHQLRDWIETQLHSLKAHGDLKAFAVQVNESLKTVRVKGAGDDGQNLLGSLGDVTFDFESGFLVITTAVGILCQYDESAYVYQFSDGRWNRIWESEQNDYSGKYAPQHLVAVHLWQAFKDGQHDGPPFVLTLGNEWGCVSVWHSVYYRVWRVDSAGAKLLVDESGFAWLRTQTYIVGSIGQESKDNAPIDVLIEFTEGSVDVDVHNREAVRHYLIDGDQVIRVDPVALRPRDFVEEWLTHIWKESATWSVSQRLLKWHQRLHADYVAGQFDGVSLHCQTPDLWEVDFEPHNAKKNFEPEPEVSFLVRWRPPYHFTMMDVADKPWARCTEEDPGADEWRTLFSTQEWRW